MKNAQNVEKKSLSVHAGLCTSQVVVAFIQIIPCLLSASRNRQVNSQLCVQMDTMILGKIYSSILFSARQGFQEGHHVVSENRRIYI